MVAVALKLWIRGRRNQFIIYSISDNSSCSSSQICYNQHRKKVVEALFIDEGFGSLDKEALTKAISVLEQIGENRMVGVISHVDDMKEGIAQQLAIIKSHDGSSRIKIVDKG